MEQLIKKGFNRFKKTFLSYFLTYILGVLFVLAFMAVALLAIALLGLLFVVLGKSTLVAVIGGVILGLGFIFGLIYIASWIQLSQTFAIVKTDIKSAVNCYKQSRELVLPFIGFGVLSSFFMIGLFYTTILLFIPLILWAIWGMFAVFAFIDGKRGGLMPLWYSKAKTTGYFWKILLYVTVIYFAFGLISYLTMQINPKYGFFNGLLWFLTTPFLMSYVYELYLSLPEPKEVKQSTGWIMVSVIGWIISVAILGFIISTSFSNMPKWLKKGEKQWFTNALPQNSLRQFENIKLN